MILDGGGGGGGSGTMMIVATCTTDGSLFTTGDWTGLIGLPELALNCDSSRPSPSLRAFLHASRAVGRSDLRRTDDFRSVTREGNVAVVATMVVV